MTSYELEERVTEALGLVVVETSGELDLTNAADLERRLQALTEGGDIGLVLDLNRVLFIDSAALHVLFRTARRLGKERLGLVVEPGGAIARTFAIVGISQVATVAASHDELPPPLASPD